MQQLLIKLYPGAFPNLKAYNKARADLVAIFATGIPGSLIGPAFGYGTYQGGSVIAEMLRLNMAIQPTGKHGAGTSNLGLLGGDLAGFPNGRRPTDDVVTIELKAVAGATIPLVDPSYTADGAVALVDQGVASEPRAYQQTFPYLADPHGGFTNRPRPPPTTITPASDEGGPMTASGPHLPAVGDGRAAVSSTAGPRAGLPTPLSSTSAVTSGPSSCSRTSPGSAGRSTSARSARRAAITPTPWFGAAGRWGARSSPASTRR